MRLQQIVYRDLFAAARELDRNPAFRALISSSMLLRPTLGGPERTTRLPHVEEYNRGLLEFLGNRSYYMPSRHQPRSARAIVRAKFRENREDPARALDAAFVALRALNDRVAFARHHGIIPATGASASTQRTGPKEPPTANGPSGQRETEEPESPLPVQQAEQLSSGIFLLAHPLLTGIFERSVIVLTEHSRKGTEGFIVNRPTKTPLTKAFKVHPLIMRAFGTSKLRRGGPVRTNPIEVLHCHDKLGGDKVVTSNFPSETEPSLFLGVELDVAAKAVEAKEIRQSDVVFVNGLSSWTPGQLEGEMQRGTWVAVRAPLSLAIDADRELWRTLMGRLGGEYEAFSRMPVVGDAEEWEEDDDDDFDDFQVHGEDQSHPRQ